MRRVSKKKLCQLIIVVSYLTLVSLTVRLVFWQPCPGSEYQSTIAFPKTLLELQQNVSDIGESWLVAVRIDWHIHSPEITGVTENVVTQEPMRSHFNKTCLRRFPYNHCVSDQIPATRQIPDTRPEACRNMTYLRNLPRASLVITFTSGHLSVIVRAVHGITRTTPSVLLADIILVHLPGSTGTEESTRTTENSIRSQFSEVVILRCDPEQGLRCARMLGVQHAQGDVIVFLQMPFEVNVNWLPPLLEPIAEDKDTVTCPVTDVIDQETFQYKQKEPPDGERKGFNWRFEPITFKRSKAENPGPNLPYTTPVLEQRSFAIRKSRYLELLGDSILDPLGGGEDIELSVKNWLCGGRIINVPCSRLGVISGSTRNTMTDPVAKNFRILAKNWFDDYDKFVLAQIGHGEERLEIKPQATEMKERLICKPFRWFLDKVSPELVEQFPPYIPTPGLGVIQSQSCRKCVSVVHEVKDSSLVPLHDCSDPRSHLNYHAHYMEDGHIRVKDGQMCLALTRYGGILYEPCSNIRMDQIWIYNETSQVLVNTETNRCLHATGSCQKAYFPTCDKEDFAAKRWWLVSEEQNLRPALSTTTRRPTTTAKIRQLD